MSKCCPDCREFIGVAGVATDGFYKRTIEDGAVIWFGTDGKAVQAGALHNALEAGYVSAVKVDCSLFEGQVNADSRFVLLEEITIADQQPTGVNVERETQPDGTVVYTNIADGSSYDPAADLATQLVKSEDADFVLDIEKGCDEGTNIQRRQWLQAGSDTPIAAPTIVDLVTGAAHTLSGNETWGAYCVSGTRFTDPVIRCAKVRDATGVVAAGTAAELVYEVVAVDAATGQPVGMALTKVAGGVAVTEGAAPGEYLIERSCC